MEKDGARKIQFVHRPCQMCLLAWLLGVQIKRRKKREITALQWEQTHSCLKGCTGGTNLILTCPLHGGETLLSESDVDTSLTPEARKNKQKKCLDRGTVFSVVTVELEMVLVPDFLGFY